MSWYKAMYRTENGWKRVCTEIKDMSYDSALSYMKSLIKDKYEKFIFVGQVPTKPEDCEVI